LENEPYPQGQYLHAARDAAAALKPSAEDIAAHSGARIAELLHQRRVQAIAEVRARSAARPPSAGPEVRP
jgi:hypothetical protein